MTIILTLKLLFYSFRFSIKHKTLEDTEKQRKAKRQVLQLYLNTKCISLHKTTIKFMVDRHTLKKYINYGNQPLGHPPLIAPQQIEDLHSYLTALNICNMRQTLAEAKKIIEKITRTSLQIIKKTT